MTLPTFLVIGAHKAATTALWSILREHPDVFLPSLKEANYFFEDGPGRWHRGRQWYESLFEPAGAAAQRGEVSPGYSMFPHFRGPPQRAAELIPDARIIYTIRHPVERMVSAWAQSVEDGYEHRNLDEALVWASSYFFPSCYGLQLSRWAADYPREAMLVIRSEDLASDPGSTIDRVLTHLGLAPGWRPPQPSARINPSADKHLARLRVRRLAGGLRGAGFKRAARQVTMSEPWKRRWRLERPLERADVELDPALAAALLECFRSDFGVLRELAGDDLDLYGVA